MLSVEHLAKSFGTTQAVVDVSLTVDRGEVVVGLEIKLPNVLGEFANRDGRREGAVVGILIIKAGAAGWDVVDE